jgi:hypothetical protein
MNGLSGPWDAALPWTPGANLRPIRLIEGAEDGRAGILPALTGRPARRTLNL